MGSPGETAILKLLKPLKRETYEVYLRLLDQQGKAHLTVLKATVCECEGEVDKCPEGQLAIVGAPVILAILGAVLALLSECAKRSPALGGKGADIGVQGAMFPHPTGVATHRHRRLHLWERPQLGDHSSEADKCRATAFPGLVKKPSVCITGSPHLTTV